MPPLRNGRASKACDLCRRYKTRCYASNNSSGACLRCQTLEQPCSLRAISPQCTSSPVQVVRDVGHGNTNGSGDNGRDGNQSRSVTDRLNRLESTIETLVDRLEGRFPAPAHTSSQNLPGHHSATKTQLPSEQNPAPVLWIRDAATSVGVQSPDVFGNQQAIQPDVISSELVSLSQAKSLLEIFRVNYGRWVRFSETQPSDTLLSDVRQSPLLLASVCLIAIRHTTQEQAERLAPVLFKEAKRLLSSALLEVPQPIEFFQATIILSLWPTTIGQVPLSIDSWLLTGYALQQGSASPEFGPVLRPMSSEVSPRTRVNAWCIWNHLCVAHLQYCVGTRRHSSLGPEQIQNCLLLVEREDVDNFEVRMAAEVRLYWIIYEKCSAAHIDPAEASRALEGWQREWAALFAQPRSQFIQMGYHFAHLLAYYRSLKSPHAVMDDAVLTEMVHRSKAIIDLAIGTADDRTRHLTDHIYHVVTFSALTLCRLTHTYEAQLQAANHDIDAMDALVVKLILWLQNIGLPCHAATLLGDIILAQFRELRPGAQASNIDASMSGGLASTNAVSAQQVAASDFDFTYPYFIESELYDVDNMSSWPQWC